MILTVLKHSSVLKYPVARVICCTKPLWSYDCDCDDSWLLLSLLLCLCLKICQFICHNLFVGDIVVPDKCTHGEVRLVGSTWPWQGRVEVCINNLWTSICDSSWSPYDAQTVCSQLGYPRTGTYSTYMHSATHT